VEGTINKPSIIARVLDDGTTQAQQYQYNTIASRRRPVDPAGRTTLLTYNTNNIDLLTVAQLAAGATNVLAQYTYNTQHCRSWRWMRRANTNYFGLQLQRPVAGPDQCVDKVVKLAYDTNVYLTTIAGPLGMTNSFTYDGYGRVRTVTDFRRLHRDHQL